MMCLDVHKFAFLYNDYKYFQWFKKNTARTCQNLKDVMVWKGLHRRGKESKKRFEELVKQVWDPREKTVKLSEADKLPEYQVVTRAFLYHLKYPLKYPILDKYVFRAMKDLKPEYEDKTNKNTNNWKKDYEDGYKPFFKNLYQEHKKEINSIKTPHINGVNKEIIKRRILDRSLWEYGRMLEGGIIDLQVCLCL